MSGPPQLPGLPLCGNDVGCPPGSTLREDIVEILRRIGLSETDEIGSNTPLDIIRHFASSQNYDYDVALMCIFNSIVASILLFITLLSFRVYYIIARNEHSMLYVAYFRGIRRFSVWAIVIVFGWSTASQLLTGITPLTVREFFMVIFWVASIDLLAIKVMAIVEAIVIYFLLSSYIVNVIRDSIRWIIIKR